MKAVILAGGKGFRLREETHLRPKPMVEIGGMPIIWHIMKIYTHFGITDFIICLGYLGYTIKEYFFNYSLHRSDVTIDVASGAMKIHANFAEPWKVTLVDTGEGTMTGGRLKRVSKHLDPEEPFCMTYGDGLSNINIGKLISFHQSHGRLATVTAVRPPARFGAMLVEEETKRVSRFEEKPIGEAGWINGGYFVLSPKVLNYIDGDSSVWEQGPLESLTADEQLSAYEHTQFWYAMDMLRDKLYLEELWESDAAPWKIW